LKNYKGSPLLERVRDVSFTDPKYQISSDTESSFVEAKYHMIDMGRNNHDYYNIAYINNSVNLPVFVHSSPDG
jgi:hypothetical protein